MGAIFPRNILHIHSLIISIEFSIMKSRCRISFLYHLNPKTAVICNCFVFY